MLTFSKAQALEYSRQPYLIAKDKNSKDEIYVVNKSERPAQTHHDPISLVSPLDLHKIRRKFQISNNHLCQRAHVPDLSTLGF